MENSNGLNSIRQKNKDVFGRSRRRYPVIIIGAVLVGILVIISVIIGKKQNQEISDIEAKTKQVSNEISRFQKQQGQSAETKIVIGDLMTRLPSTTTVSEKTINAEIRDYIQMTGIDSSIASYGCAADAKAPDTIVGLSENVKVYECSITVSAEGLEKITKLLNYIYSGDTYYYLYSYSVEASNNTVNATVTLYTFAVAR